MSTNKSCWRWSVSPLVSNEHFPCITCIYRECKGKCRMDWSYGKPHIDICFRDLLECRLTSRLKQSSSANGTKVLFLWICHLSLTSLKEWNFMSEFSLTAKGINVPGHTLTFWGYSKYRCYFRIIRNENIGRQQ